MKDKQKRVRENILSVLDDTRILYNREIKTWFNNLETLPSEGPLDSVAGFTHSPD